ncbi:MAG: ATP-binding protein [Desulfobacterales bacterium]
MPPDENLADGEGPVATVKMIQRIAITGPECSGKTTLAEALATHFGTLWVPEYARQYLAKLGRPYRFEDIGAIARGQLRSEARREPGAKRFLFCDTELIVAKIWSEFRFQRCDPWILATIDIHRYALYLLTDIDLPWEDDPLREQSAHRPTLFHLYCRELVARSLPFEVLSGSRDNRLRKAVRALEARFGPP